MAEVVLSDALVNDLSEQINIPLYPVSHFAVDLGFDFVAASAAEQLAIQKQHPHEKYLYILNKFVTKHGRGEESAQYLIDRFKVKEKMLLVNFLEEVIKRQNALKESGLAEGQRQTGTNVNARNKSIWKFGKGLTAVLLAIVVACTWNNLFPEPRKCAPSPCQNGGTCYESRGEYSCTCKTGYGDSNCETEYIAETFSLEECQDTLRRHYNTVLFKIPIKPWDPEEDVDLEGHYSTVSLYKEDKNNADRPVQKLTLNGSVNDIFQTKVRGSLPERIVLFGEAGRGKTTAVAKMAYDWTNKKEDSPLKNVKLLFVFKMRTMNSKTGMTEAIVQLLGTKYRKYKQELEDYIDSNEKDIVMLFDGYDEFSGELNCKENVHVGNVIDILCQKRCRRCRVLVTSRPIRKEDFKSRDFYYSKMVIGGYSQQQVTYFIDKFFSSNETKGTELKKYLEEDIVTKEMIATPLFSTMVCYLWNEGYIRGNYTRTKLFDDIMEFLRKHLNAKGEIEIDQDLLDVIVVSVGQVAYTKLSKKTNLNPLLFSDDDFSEVHDDNVGSSYSLGLLTKSMKTDSDIIINIEFFHKLAQEYSAGRYFASAVIERRHLSFVFQEAYDLTEVLKFAAGTSDSVRQRLLVALFKGNKLRYSSTNQYRDFDHVILDLHSEAGTCAKDSDEFLTYFFEDQKILLQQVTASTVVGFEKLPESLKKKITTIVIYEMNGSPHLFVRLWNSMNTSSLLSHLHIPIPVDFPANIRSNLKHLTSIRDFQAHSVLSVSSLAHVLTFLPKVMELDIQEIDPVELENTEAFCELWTNLHTSPDLNRLLLSMPSSRNIPCDLEPIRSVQDLVTSSSIHLPVVLINLPNLQKLRLDPSVRDQEMDVKSANELFIDLWRVLHSLHELRDLELYISCKVHWLFPEPLRSVQIFRTKIDSNMEVFQVLLSLLPNIIGLKVLVTNNYDRKIADDTYYDKVVSVIIDELTKNGVQLKVLFLNFDPRSEASKTVSRDTVKNFIRMLKTSGMMLQLEIISHPYCVLNEFDLIEITKAIREFTSIEILRIECCLHYEGELSRFAKHQTQDDYQEIGEQSEPLILTLYYRDREDRCTDSRTEEFFVFPR